MMSFYEQFPNLQAKEMQLENDVERIKSQIRETKVNPRYADNEAERAYQLEQLEAKMENTLAAAEEDFQIELQATELHLAEQAFSMPDVSEEDRDKAESLAKVIKTQLLVSTNKDDTLDLLSTRIKSMNDAEKQAVKLELISMNIDGLDEVMTALNDTAHMREISQQQEALKRIKRGAGSLRRKYDAIEKAVKQAISAPPSLTGGNIDRDYYEKHLKGGRK